MLIGLIGKLEQRQGEIGGDRHVEFGVAECGNNDGVIADTARDLLAADVQLRMQAVHRKRTIVGILNVELDRETLLQKIPSTDLDADDCDIGPRKFWRDQRTAAKGKSQGENLQQAWHHAGNDTDFLDSDLGVCRPRGCGGGKRRCAAWGAAHRTCRTRADRACRSPIGHLLGDG